MMVCTRQMLTVIKGVTPLLIKNHFYISVNGDLPACPDSLIISLYPSKRGSQRQGMGSFSPGFISMARIMFHALLEVWLEDKFYAGIEVNNILTKGKAGKPNRPHQSSFPVKSIQNPPFNRRDEPIVYEPRTIMVFAISRSS